MSTPKSLPADLTLDIGDDLPPNEFVTAIKNFLGYVTEITGTQKGDDPIITWTVRVMEGSSLIGVAPDSGAPNSRISTIYKQAGYGPVALSKGNIARSGLTEKAIGHLKGLSDLAERHGGGKGINIWVSRKAIRIDGDISRAIQEDRSSDYHDYGTLEGRLEAIQDANGSLKIKVRDCLFANPVACLVPEKMIDEVFRSFRKRVEIEGRIHYRRNGTPISIEACQIDILPEDDELPSASDVYGIMATG